MELRDKIRGLSIAKLRYLAVGGRWEEAPPSVNPNWIIGEAIEALYDRELIDEKEMDFLRYQAGL